MSDERRRAGDSRPGITPMAGLLMTVNAVVFLVLQTVLTAPGFTDALRFTPGDALGRPWTFLTYLVTHAGIGSLAATTIGLFAFGPALERRLGGRSFILYYLYCGVGASLFCLALGPLLATPVAPFLGGSGAILGLAFAYATLWPEEEMFLFPLPVRVSARTLGILLAVAALGLALATNDEVVHLASLGGMVSGSLFFRLQAFRERRALREPKAITRRAVMAPIPVRQGGSPAADIRPALGPAEPPPPDHSTDALDRVLDKISASGLKSLTPEERHFLDEVARRKRNDVQ